MILDFVAARRAVVEHRPRLSAKAASLATNRLLPAGDVLVPDAGLGSPIPLRNVSVHATADVPDPDWESMRAAAGGLFPVGGPYVGFAAEVARSEPDRHLWDGTTYRLLDVVRSDRGLDLHFGLGTYFAALDTGEVLAHELAARPDGLALRALHADPFDLTTRSAAMAVSALTLVRRRSGPRFYMIRRSPLVAVAPGLVHVVPAGEFQPRAGAAAPLSFGEMDLVGVLGRELVEEVGGVDESGSDGHALSAALDSGAARASVWGVALDPLTLRPELLGALVFDEDAFDGMFPAIAPDVPEGTLLVGADGGGLPFDAETVSRLTAPGADVVSFAAATLHLAWRDRATLLER